MRPHLVERVFGCVVSIDPEVAYNAQAFGDAVLRARNEMIRQAQEYARPLAKKLVALALQLDRSVDDVCDEVVTTTRKYHAGKPFDGRDFNMMLRSDRMIGAWREEATLPEPPRNILRMDPMEVRRVLDGEVSLVRYILTEACRTIIGNLFASTGRFRA